MKRLLPFLLLMQTAVVALAQWQVTVPDLPEPVGLKHLHALDDSVAWVATAKWNVSNSGYTLAGSDKSHFLRTADGGQTWVTGEVPLGDFPYPSNIHSVSATEAWLSGVDRTDFESYILHTTDGGLTWERVSEDLFAHPSSFINYIHFWDEQNGIALGDPATDDSGALPYYEIYRTSNGAQTWERVPRDSFFPDDVVNGDAGWGGGYYFQGNSIWYPSGSNRFYVSNNRGQSWYNLDMSGAYKTMAFADDLFGVRWNANAGKFSITQDGGFNWEIVTSPPAGNGTCVSLVAVPGSHYLLAVMLGHPINGPFTTVLSTDLGETWMEIGTGENAAEAQLASPTAIYAGEWQPADHPTRMYRYNGEALFISGLLSGKPLEAEVEVFPNPASDFVSIKVNAVQTADFLLLVNDVQGRLVERRVFENTAAFSASLYVRALPAGVYSLTLSTSQGMLTQQFIKA